MNPSWESQEGFLIAGNTEGEKLDFTKIILNYRKSIHREAAESAELLQKFSAPFKVLW